MDYKTGPTADEPEIVIFGPGYGEAIVVHLGDRKWLLVDSCRNPNTRKTASIEYLEAIGASDDEIVGIVASHWHDDHVRGISEICERFPKAELFISGVFDNEEAMAFLSAFSGASTRNLSRGTKELHTSVLASSSEVVPTYYRTSIADFTRADNSRVRVLGFSPNPAGQAKALRHFVSYIPAEGDPGADGDDADLPPINYAPELKPNSESVVVHIQLGEDAILLGSDLEHHGDEGWQGIAESRWARDKLAAAIYKVAHHGSITGEYDGIWTELLQSKPICLLTPFVWGKVKLPKDTDRHRILERSSEAYISSGASRRAWYDRETENSLGRICEWLTPINNGFGAVRVRRTNNVWETSLFGDAIHLGK
ncbi:MBL fold metallo-hydrolase [Burkholderia sola]